MSAVAPSVPSQPLREKRRAPRVAAGKPVAMRYGESETALQIEGGVIDISRDGCRLALPRDRLPASHRWNSGSKCRLSLRLSGHHEVSLAAAIVWSQRLREGFDLVGCRFEEQLPTDAAVVEKFVVQRLRAELRLPEPGFEAEIAPTFAALEFPLEMEMTAIGTQKTYAVLLCEVAAQRLRFKIRADQCWPPDLNKGAIMDIAVHPPVWARGERRTLRFAGRLSQIAAGRGEVEFQASGSDLAQMIQDLIPPRITRPPKPLEVDLRLIVLVVAIILLALILASLRSP